MRWHHQEQLIGIYKPEKPFEGIKIMILIRLFDLHVGGEKIDRCIDFRNHTYINTVVAETKWIIAHKVHFLNN